MSVSKSLSISRYSSQGKELLCPFSSGIFSELFFIKGGKGGHKRSFAVGRGISYRSSTLLPKRLCILWFLLCNLTLSMILSIYFLYFVCNIMSSLKFFFSIRKPVFRSLSISWLLNYVERTPCKILKSFFLSIFLSLNFSRLFFTTFLVSDKLSDKSSDFELLPGSVFTTPVF